MLAYEWQPVAMATGMGPVDRSPALAVVQAAARFTVAVRAGVLRVLVPSRGVLRGGGGERRGEAASGWERERGEGDSR